MTVQKNIKTTVEDISRKNPFTVPENYFDNFTLRMADKISQFEDRKVSKFTFAKVRPRYAVVVLTSLAVFLIFGIHFLNQSNSKKLSINEFKKSIEYSIVSDMDENELIGQLEVAENNSTIPTDSLAKSNHEYSKHLIDYLSKEDVDLNSIEDAM